MIIRRLDCKKCKHVWIPRTDDPIECPKCKSRNWKGEENGKTKS